MVHRGEPDAALLLPCAVVARDFEVLADELHGGDPAKADNDFGVQELRLPAKITDARVLLGTERVPVVRRAALNNVCDIAVVPPKVNDAQHVIQEFPGGPDKRLSGQILLLARAFSDEENFRVRRPHAEDDVVPRLAQGAHRALQTCGFQRFPIHARISFPAHSSRSSR